MPYLNVIVREPNIALQSIGDYSKSDSQPYIRTQQFQELLTKMDTTQCSQLTKTSENLQKHFYRQLPTRLQWYFKDIKDYIYLNGEKCRPQRVTKLYARFDFVGFLFSLLKGSYNACAINTQINKPAGLAGISFAVFFEKFSTSINKVFEAEQISE